MHPDFWGRGPATAIGRCLLDIGVGELGLHRIAGTYDPRNVASGKVLARLGMTVEGTLHETMRLADGGRDSIVAGILAHER